MHAYGPRQSINCMVFPSIKIPYTVLCACMDAHRPWKWINWSFLAWTSIKQFTAYENSPRNCMYYSVSTRGHTLHSLVHMHTNLVCAQTAIFKQGHALHNLLHMHTDIIYLCTNWRYQARKYTTQPSLYACVRSSVVHKMAFPSVDIHETLPPACAWTSVVYKHAFPAWTYITQPSVTCVPIAWSRKWRFLA